MIDLRLGDCLTVLRSLESESVHCVVTSPPYWGLRSYQTEPQIWANGHEPCIEHQWGDTSYQRRSNDNGKTAKQLSNYGANRRDEPVKNDTCSVCGAWRGELGLEPTPELFVEHLVQIFREVKRVIRDDGTLWLNLGDSYAGGTQTGRNDNGRPEKGRGWAEYDISRVKAKRELNGLKPKDLVGIPWMVAFALRADGWYLRSDCIWAKPNPMPESVTDRPTKAHEYIFLLSKSQKYYYDATAVRENFADERMGNPGNYKNGYSDGAGRNDGATKGKEWLKGTERGGRNRRTVWTVPTAPFKGAHFATFPPKLIEPCILAGTSAKGVCSKCGAPWERVTERGELIPDNPKDTHGTIGDKYDGMYEGMAQRMKPRHHFENKEIHSTAVRQ